MSDTASQETGGSTQEENAGSSVNNNGNDEHPMEKIKHPGMNG